MKQNQPYTSLEWMALGTNCALVIYDPDGGNWKDLARQVALSSQDFEQRFSRFLPNSELTQFNSLPAGQYQVSQEFYDLLTKAQSLYRATGGFFDPTIINRLESYGYLETQNNWPLQTTKHPQTKVATAIFLQLELLPNRTVTKPANLRLDLGGIGKSWLLKKLAETKLAPIENYYLSLGGDSVVHGRGSQEEAGWSVIIETANQTIIIKNGTLCTSGTARRHGTQAGKKWHHIIDPQTQQSLATPVLAVTVLGQDPIWTEQVARLALKEYQQINQAWLKEKEMQQIWLKLPNEVKHYG